MAHSPSSLLRKGEHAVLVLQGGGALGAYQAGVLEELHNHELAPSWLAGVSIGAINASIFAGNPPERRVQRLREFWRLVSSRFAGRPLMSGGTFHEAFNETSSFLAATWGVPGFFKPRLFAPIFLPDGTQAALSFYDTAPLQKTLTDLIDFDLINSGKTRLSLGAVNIKTGNFVYFDSRKQKIGPEHVMASGALPPGLPPIAIEGELYWDGGLVSNTPLQIVLDEVPESDLCVFQVDVFSAEGELPSTIFDVYEREKEIRFSSRTRLNTDVFLREQERKRTVQELLKRLPPELAQTKEARFLQDLMPQFGTTIVHLIYRKKPYEGWSYDYEFSRVSVEEHWKAGRAATRETLHHPHWIHRRVEPGLVEVLDLTKPSQGAPDQAAQEPKEESKPIPSTLRKGAAR